MTHRVDLGALPNSPKPPESPDVMSHNEPSGIAGRGQNCSLRKTLSVKMNGSNGDPGHCNSNADYLSFITTADAVTARYGRAIAAISDELLCYRSLPTTFTPPI